MQHHYQTTTVTCRPRVNIKNFCGPAVVVRSSRGGVHELRYEDVASDAVQLMSSDVHHYVILTFILRMRT